MMSVFELINDCLSTLNIPIARSIYKGKAKAYIVVSIYRQVEVGYDNTAELEKSSLRINYWHSENEPDLSKQIRFLLGGKGFRFINSMDLYDEGFHGTSMNFEVTLNI